MDVAEQGIAELKDKVDTLVVVPNQRLTEATEEDISFVDAMKKADNVLAEGVKSIAGLITHSGFINVDFADVRAIMQGAGSSLMGIGKASGENRAEVAARMATNSPLLDLSIEGAQGVLFNVIGGLDLSMKEVDLAAQLIQEAVDPDANIIFGASIDENLEEEIIITIIATGFDAMNKAFNTSSTTASLDNKASITSDADTQKETDKGKMDELQEAEEDITSTETHSTDTQLEEEEESDSLDIDTEDFEDDLDIPAFLRNSKKDS